MMGDCVGPGGSNDYPRYVNAKWQSSITRAACRAGCDASPSCTGYNYRTSGGYCYVYGPGLDTDLAGGVGWHAATWPTTTIAGANGHGGNGYSGRVCVAVAGRN
jgi:hypothetical protein